MAATSRARGPLACVPVNESPYNRLTEPPVGCIFAEGYTGIFVLLHTVVLHASETTHKSLDPVSTYIMISQVIALDSTPADKHTEIKGGHSFPDGNRDAIESRTKEWVTWVMTEGNYAPVEVISQPRTSGVRATLH